MYKLEELTEIIREIVMEYPVTKVILVGSYAKNTATGISDVDLVLDGENLSEAYWEILFKLEDRLGTPVDIMTMRGLDRSLIKDDVMKGAMPIYEA